MNKQMNAVKVCTLDGEIVITQDKGRAVMLIRPEQVELLCAWLEIAKEEIEQGAGDK